ncbi:MAG TPA: hypothetical protein VFW64_10740 [Pseudonocardiaceae bacterium]|nr:hypothetical protein [Pseudonocardiaceae bacterium]
MRVIDPLRQWKLSPVDLAALDRWDDYTQAKEAMFQRTDTPAAPWTVVKSNDKKRGRIAALRWVLSTLDYPTKESRCSQHTRPADRRPASPRCMSKANATTKSPSRGGARRWDAVAHGRL